MVKDAGDSRSVWTAARVPPLWVRRTVVVRSPVRLRPETRRQKREGFENLRHPHPSLITPKPARPVLELPKIMPEVRAIILQRMKKTTPRTPRNLPPNPRLSSQQVNAKTSKDMSTNGALPPNPAKSQKVCRRVWPRNWSAAEVYRRAGKRNSSLVKPFHLMCSKSVFLCPAPLRSSSRRRRLARFSLGWKARSRTSKRRQKRFSTCLNRHCHPCRHYHHYRCPNKLARTGGLLMFN